MTCLDGLVVGFVLVLEMMVNLNGAVHLNNSVIIQTQINKSINSLAEAVIDVSSTMTYLHLKGVALNFGKAHAVFVFDLGFLEIFFLFLLHIFNFVFSAFSFMIMVL